VKNNIIFFNKKEINEEIEIIEAQIDDKEEEIEYIQELIENLEEKYKIEKDKIYETIKLAEYDVLRYNFKVAYLSILIIRLQYNIDLDRVSFEEIKINSEFYAHIINKKEKTIRIKALEAAKDALEVEYINNRKEYKFTCTVQGIALKKIFNELDEDSFVCEAAHKQLNQTPMPKKAKVLQLSSYRK